MFIIVIRLKTKNEPNFFPLKNNHTNLHEKCIRVNLRVQKNVKNF